MSFRAALVALAILSCGPPPPPIEPSNEAKVCTKAIACKAVVNDMSACLLCLAEFVRLNADKIPADLPPLEEVECSVLRALADVSNMHECVRENYFKAKETK